MTAAAAPSLLCLNLRQEHIHDARAIAPALANLARAVAEARAEGRRIIHAYAVHPRRAGCGFGALPGFEPAAHEPVFALKSISALSEPQILEAAQTAPPMRVVGGVFSRSGLATALAASDAGIGLEIFEDGCFAPSIAALDRQQILDAVRANRRGDANDGMPGWGKNVICLYKKRS